MNDPMAPNSGKLEGAAAEDLTNDCLRSAYQRVLYGFLEGGGEASRMAAYDLARTCLRQGLAMDDVLAVHLELADARLTQVFGPQALEQAQTLLLDTFMAFSLAYRQTVEALEHAKHELEANARFRSRMLSMVAHDLGNHNVAIRLMTQACLKKITDAETRTRLEHVLSVVEDEEHLLTNLLELARIEAGRLELHLEAVDLEALLRRSVERLASQSPRHRFDLDLPQVEVCADRLRMIQIIENLLSNAVKYSPQGGTVEVRGMVTEQRELQVTIRDQGVGIAPEDLPQIFEPFYRAVDPASSGLRGAGLGLSIVRSLMRLQGGDITAVSQPDEGSTFTLRLGLA